MEVPRISALLSDEARRGWERVCLRERVSLSALLEALGRHLDESPGELPDVFDLAAEVDRERGNR